MAVWWAWAVSFADHSVFDAAWPEFLDGAGVDPAEPDLADRVETLQVLRMLELRAGQTGLSPEIQRIVHDRLLTMLR